MSSPEDEVEQAPAITRSAVFKSTLLRPISRVIAHLNREGLMDQFFKIRQEGLPKYLMKRFGTPLKEFFRILTDKYTLRFNEQMIRRFTFGPITMFTLRDRGEAYDPDRMKVILFPKEASVQYQIARLNKSEELFTREGQCPIAIVVPPTTKYTKRFGIISQYGILELQSDKKEIINPFEKGTRDAQIQMGGILIGPEGRIKVLTYQEMISIVNGQRLLDINPGMTAQLIQGEFYMDSDNWTKVVSLPNIRDQLNEFNMIGTFSFPDGEVRIFCLDTDQFHTVHLSLVAQALNAIAKNLKASSWTAIGLEYSGGGTYFVDSKKARATHHLPDSSYEQSPQVIILPGEYGDPGPTLNGLTDTRLSNRADRLTIYI